MKILCVDDAEVVRNVIRHEVTRLGYDFFSAPDAYEAMEIIKKNELDLIFLDLNMPGKNGLELLEEVKKQEIKTGVVIMLTTEGSIELKARGRDLGVRAWVIKPLKRGMLEQIISKVSA